MNGKRNIFSAAWPPLLVFLAATALAEVLVRLFQVPIFLLPPPSAVLRFIADHPADLLTSLSITAEAALIGFFASALVGILLAIALSASNLVRRAFYPYAVFFQTVPIVAIAPLLMIWCGPGLTAVAISAFVVSVFPVIANTLAGLLSTDPALEDLFRLNGASAWSRLWKLRFPSATPNIVTGLRIAAGLAVIGTVVGEFLVGLLGTAEGLGVRIISAKKMGRTDELFADVLMASLLGLAMFAAVNLAGRLLLRHWHASEREETS
jgi:NitT/TauT family transport system permease protein